MTDVIVFTDRLSHWRFIQDVEHDIRITKDKEIYNKNELIAVITGVYFVVWALIGLIL